MRTFYLSSFATQLDGAHDYIEILRIKCVIKKKEIHKICLEHL